MSSVSIVTGYFFYNADCISGGAVSGGVRIFCIFLKNSKSDISCLLLKVAESVCDIKSTVLIINSVHKSQDITFYDTSIVAIYDIVFKIINVNIL